jgi:hypothetical protein
MGTRIIKKPRLKNAANKLLAMERRGGRQGMYRYALDKFFAKKFVEHMNSIGWELGLHLEKGPKSKNLVLQRQIKNSNARGLQRFKNTCARLDAILSNARKQIQERIIDDPNLDAPEKKTLLHHVGKVLFSMESQIIDIKNAIRDREIELAKK